MTDACRNCGTLLAGRWCHACGQDASSVMRPWRELLAVWGDAVLGWDTRAGRTLRALVLEPGRLTVEYAAGHLAGWIHPLRLYLAASVIALAVFSATSARIVSHFIAESGAISVYSHMGSMLLAISTAMVVLLPVGGACYALAFRGLRRYYAEHLVFTLHTAAFAFLAQAAASLVQYASVLADAPSSFLTPPRIVAHVAMFVYVYLAARRSYGLGAWQTLARLALTNVLAAPLLLATAWVVANRGG
jgi:hypothetical protein